MTKPYYITTPLYYVNAKPHIGHAYTQVLCDTFARFHRLCGDEVFFMTGTDEHGTKIDKAAKEAGKAPKQFVDEIVPEFKKLWQALGIEYDFFIRTTDSFHKEAVAETLKQLELKGEIYSSKYKGWYCTPCESFWTKLQLKDGKCPDCGREVQELEEENYFFKLSKYQDWLVGYIKSHHEFIQPESRRNEILNFLSSPLEDLCITRPKSRLSWGIPYPNSDQHVVYVWFDALLNYVTAQYSGEVRKKFRSLWPADVHMIGKDILRQHVVYWPIMLKAMELEMPRKVVAHGWWTVGGDKMSKSKGNALDPMELIQKYTVDGFRYYLMKEVTLGQDGTYSEDLMTERYHTDLANDLGNLVMRTTAMIDRYFGGVIIETEGKTPLQNVISQLGTRVKNEMSNYDPRSSLELIWGAVKEANRFIDNSKPWALSKEGKTEELALVLIDLCELIRVVGILLQPFLPLSAAKILKCFGIKTLVGWSHADKIRELKPGLKVEKCEILFPKFEVKK